MTTKHARPAWTRAFLMATAALAIGLTATTPADADYRRSCRAVLELRAAGTNTAVHSYQWSVFNTVTWPHELNESRREIRRALTTCMRTHWDERDAASAPIACQSRGALEFQNYPFDALASDLRRGLCDANPGTMSMDIDLVLFIDGENGCVVDGGNINPATRIDLGTGFTVVCAVPDAGGWECVGEGCDGDDGIPEGGSDERAGPPGRPGLPGVRLPGNDIGGGWIGLGGTWEVCWQMCNDNDACGAWTWRGPGTTPGSDQAGCLLKSRAGPQIHDPCCHSGIMD